MLLEPLSFNGKPQGKCFAEKCEDCCFYRKWRVVVDERSGRTLDIPKCSWEALFFNLPAMKGAIDGLQGAVNHTSNVLSAALDFAERKKING